MPNFKEDKDKFKPLHVLIEPAQLKYLRGVRHSMGAKSLSHAVRRVLRDVMEREEQERARAEEGSSADQGPDVREQTSDP